MTSLFSDISDWNSPVNDSYPFRFLSFRANDGTYTDQHFFQNRSWVQAKVKQNRLDGYCIYFVWEPNWQETIQTTMNMIGDPSQDSNFAIMMDVESWGGRISGNHSGDINATREQLIKFLGGNRDRVFGYGNRYDLAAIWPDRNDAKLIVASYGGNYPSDIPGVIAQQYASDYYVSTFGRSDINVTPMSSVQFCQSIGIGSGTESPDNHNVIPLPLGDEDGMYIIIQNADTPGSIALVGTGVWQPLTYGPNPVSVEDIKVLLSMSLCKSKTIIPVSGARYNLLKQKVGGH